MGLDLCGGSRVRAWSEAGLCCCSQGCSLQGLIQPLGWGRGCGTPWLWSGGLIQGDWRGCSSGPEQGSPLGILTAPGSGSRTEG